MAQLMRLQIPNNWTVSDNKFYDTDPVVDKDGNIVNWHEGFTEDVLWIQETIFRNEKFETPQFDCFDVDLSYLSGHYVAKLRYTSQTETHEIDLLKSKDRTEIRNKIETWLKDISDNHADYKKKCGHVIRTKTVCRGQTANSTYLQFFAG